MMRTWIIAGLILGMSIFSVAQQRYIEKQVVETKTVKIWILNEIAINLDEGIATMTFRGYATVDDSKNRDNCLKMLVKTVKLADVPCYAQIDALIAAYILTLPELSGGEIKQ